MADKKKAILLRIPPDLWDGLNRWARDEIRSVNAQIEYILREAVRKRSGNGERQEPSTEQTTTDTEDSPSSGNLG